MNQYLLKEGAIVHLSTCYPESDNSQVGCFKTSIVLKLKEWPSPRGWAPSKSIIEKSLFQSGSQWAHPREAGQAQHHWFPQGKARRSWNDWCNPGEGNQVWNDWCPPQVGTQSKKVWPLRMLIGAKWAIQLQSGISLQRKKEQVLVFTDNVHMQGCREDLISLILPRTG